MLSLLYSTYTAICTYNTYVNLSTGIRYPLRANTSHFVLRRIYAWYRCTCFSTSNNYIYRKNFRSRQENVSLSIARAYILIKICRLIDKQIKGVVRQRSNNNASNNNYQRDIRREKTRLFSRIKRQKKNISQIIPVFIDYSFDGSCFSTLLCTFVYIYFLNLISKLVVHLSEHYTYIRAPHSIEKLSLRNNCQ